MGTIHKNHPVKLVIGFISAEEKLFASAQAYLIKKFGKIDFQSKIIPFNFTDYYREEFGLGLKRKFISFKRLIPADELVQIKILANSLEEKFSKGKKRRLNIDPGYLDSAKLVLATTKDFNHRIFLGKGIFAEVTLTYKKDSFQPFEWTYPDYRSQQYLAIFNGIRAIYRSQIK